MWYTHVFGIKRARKDIVVIKPLSKSNGHYWDLNERYYKLNKVYTDLVKIKRNGLFELAIDGGFKSYSIDGVIVSKDALTYNNTTIKKPNGIFTICIIPKGSFYCKKDNTILSDKIKIVWDETLPVQKSF